MKFLLAQQKLKKFG